MRFNNDTGSNYSMTVLTGDGSGSVAGVGSYLDANQTSFSYPGYYDTAMGMNVIQIKNYSDTLRWKTFMQRNSKASNQTQMATGLWRSTAVINQIDIYTATGATWTTATKATLYGIKAVGGDTTPKATGGIVTEDSTYYYHTFKGSSTFTPLQSLTSDILIVAGGAGGGNWNGGGGGAGGLLAYTSQSLTATPYQVLVGAGGAGSKTDSAKGSNGGNSQFVSLTAAVGGGGGASTSTIAGASGGSGGGGSAQGGAGGTNTSGQGFAGGAATNGLTPIIGGGGGGASEAGNTDATGFGGDGVNTYSSWLSATGLGVSGFIAGGGAGGIFDYVARRTGGDGGGGDGGTRTDGMEHAFNAVASTGSGGGGGGYGQPNNGPGNGGNGGSGIVIVRYAKV
jgi:hypothetical protein